MEFYYVITNTTVQSDSDLTSTNMNRRKVSENAFAVQIWSSEELAKQYLKKMPKGSELKTYKVERSSLLHILKKDGAGTQVELDAT